MNVYCPILVGGQYLPARSMNRSMPGGRDESPRIEWSDVPTETKSFCLTISDLDAGPQPQTLWSIINIPFEIRAFLPNASLATELLPSECVQLTNALGNQRYDGPSLLPDSPPHRISFELIALSVQKLNVGLFTPVEERLKTIRSKMIDRASLDAMATRSR
ncbi:MAG TPA: YbhB/YbcL family Raf kinase inhibitor-like protein [Bacteroidota bacterium]|nr:YbhB/YbcL family Raf kinase inhibitor-like protein [Bacteroidota bacterium]